MSDQSISWSWKRFQEFNTSELHELLAARIDVFIVEQQCVYQDLDGQDPGAYHLRGLGDQGLAAYLRLLPPGSRYPEPSIGRVFTVAAYRGRQLGRELMSRGIQGCRHYYPGQTLRVSAQAYLLAFYQGLGFVSVGPDYDDDGIPHVDMMLDTTAVVPESSG